METSKHYGRYKKGLEAIEREGLVDFNGEVNTNKYWRSRIDKYRVERDHRRNPYAKDSIMPVALETLVKRGIIIDEREVTAENMLYAEDSHKIEGYIEMCKSLNIKPDKKLIDEFAKKAPHKEIVQCRHHYKVAETWDSYIEKEIADFADTLRKM